MGLFRKVGRRITGKSRHFTIKFDKSFSSYWTDDEDTSTVGNPYRNHHQQAYQLSRRFDGLEDWGCSLVNTVIHMRAAFTLGGGVKVRVRDGADAEREFVDRFIERNRLLGSAPLQFAREAEIEGRFIQIMRPDMQTGDINLRYLSWVDNHYTVVTSPDDYATFTSVEYRDPETNREVSIPGRFFVYKPFNGRIGRINAIGPRLGPVIRLFDDLDKAYKDWRKINHLHASPTPVIECEPGTDVDKIEQDLNSKNWTIGKLMVIAGGKYQLAGLQRAGVNSIEQEISSIAKLLSAATGLPVHFLGLPELMSNRSTADNLMEMIDASTENERRCWKDFYHELFTEAMLLSNEFFRTGLDPDAVTVETPFISAARMSEISSIWLPMYQAGTISLDTLLSKIPDLDAEEEQDKLEESAIDLLRPANTAGTQDDGEPEDANQNE